MAFDKNGRCESCGSSIKNQNGLCCECLDWPDKVNELNSVVAELLAVLTTDEIDGSTLVETLNSARIIILRSGLYLEIAEELCAWAEKLSEHKGESNE